MAANRGGFREKVGFDFQADRVWGDWEMLCGTIGERRAGSPALTGYAMDALAEGGVDVVPTDEVIPFADHFPFSVFGIPSLWVGRSNFPAGRWQHHSAHDTLENVSVSELVRLLSAVGPMIQDLAGADRWPFRRGLPPSQREVTRRYARELFGLRV